MSSKIQILGLKNCDKCRDAQKKLKEVGHDIEFVDLRLTPIGVKKTQELVGLFGDQILNKLSTTYRGLPPSEKKLPMMKLLEKYPVLIKRPVILSSEVNSIGWSRDIINKWITK